MKHLVICLIFILPAWVSAQSRYERITTEVETVERKRFAAQVNKDYIALEQILADDLVYVHSSGNTDTKASFIQSIKEGKSVYNAIDVKELKVRFYGNYAVINGVIVITQNPKPDGSPTLLSLKYLAVYTKNRRKGWQIHSWQSLKLTN